MELQHRSTQMHELLIRKRLGRGQSQGVHAHPAAALTFVLHGSFSEELHTDHRQSTDHHCDRFSLQFKPASVDHTTRIGPAGVEMLVVNLPERVARTLSDPSAKVVRGGIVTALASVLANPGAAPLHAGALDRLLGWWPPGTACDAPDWLLDARAWVAQGPNPEAAPNFLVQLAEKFDRHPVYVARAFRRHFGCSVGEYRRQARLNGVAERLMFSDANVATVAAELGYADQSHLNHEFKAATGIAPGHLRAIANHIGVH
jgi:AraC family transcriptional regulator